MPTILHQRATYETVDGSALELLIWRPARGGPWPGVMDLHGGFWTFYSAELDFYLCHALASRGFVVAAVEFRLAPRHPWPTSLEDVRAAARFFRHHAAHFEVDPGLGLGVIGGSSGGHLAAMLALQPNGASTGAADTPETTPCQVDWAAPLWPILDPAARFRMVRSARFRPLVRAAVQAIERQARPVADPTKKRMVSLLKRLDDVRRRWPARGERLAQLLLEGRTAYFESPIGRALLYRAIERAQSGMFADLDEMEAASPVGVLRRNEQQATVPMFVVHGLRDTNMTVEMTESFVDAHRARGGRVETWYPPKQGHAFGVVPSRASDELADRIAAFARKMSP